MAVVFTHLTFRERDQIAALLSEGKSLSFIARELKRDQKSITDEIKRNRTPVFKGSYSKAKNSCVHAFQKACKLRNVCPTCVHRNRLCVTCGKCEEFCASFQNAVCPKLIRSPFCCNGCTVKHLCTIRRFEYRPSIAHEKAAQRLKEARFGSSYTLDELTYIGNLFREGIKLGQSVHHIYESQRNQMICSERQVYLLINQGLLDISRLDLPRTVQQRPRAKKKMLFKVDKQCHVGRTYDDYLDYVTLHPDIGVVQMDCVESVKEDSTCLLSLSWTLLQFYLVFPLERQTAACVTKVFTDLYALLGSDRFAALFQLILTDRGSEFTDPTAIEKFTGTKIFYCDPLASHQKGNVENVNGQLRRIIPKGYSFQTISATDCSLVNSHLNSYIKASINNKTASDLVEVIYGKDVLDLLQVKKIPPAEVTLRPSLLAGVLVRKNYEN